MSIRPRPTFVDFIVSAFNPVLIMLLVGSLVFFLVDVFYQGQYSGRLHWVLALFVMAVVLITRIAMEQDEARATGYALALGLVTWAALERFVEFGGGLRRLSPVINLGLMLLVWAVAHWLTRECTSVEGEGPPAEGSLWEQARQRALGWLRRRKEVAAEKSPQVDEEGLTAPSSPAAGENELRAKKRTGPRHMPGLSILYVSLVALPIFGLGELLAGTHRLERRGWLVLLLAVYLGSAFGLLLSTSFLSLRRYLRTRRVEMPEEMTATWLAWGVGFILLALAVAWVFPRPRPVQVAAQVAGWVYSPRTTSSPMAPPGEAATDARPGDPARQIAPRQPHPEVPDHTTARPSEAEQADQASGPNPAGSRPSGGVSSPGGPEAAEASGQVSANPAAGRSEDPPFQGNLERGQIASVPRSEGTQSSARGTPEKTRGLGSEIPSAERESPQVRHPDDGKTPPAQGAPSGAEDAGRGYPSGRENREGRSPDVAQQPGQPEGSSPPEWGETHRAEGARAPEAEAKHPRGRDSQAGKLSPQMGGTSVGGVPSSGGGGIKDRSAGGPSSGKFDQSGASSPETTEQVSTGSAGRWPPAAPLGQWGDWLARALPWVLLACLVVGLALWGWRNRSAIGRWLADLAGILQEFWQSLFGGLRTGKTEEAVPDAPPERRVHFAHFVNPFRRALWRRMDKAQLVVYTFQALEAWASDFAEGRGEFETPLEFVTRLGDFIPEGQVLLRQLGEMYARLAYSPAGLPQLPVDNLRALWELLEQKAQNLATSDKAAGPARVPT